jgi:hypothetical protein
VHTVQVGQLQLGSHLLNEGGLLGDSVHAGDVSTWAADGDDDAGQATTRTNVHESRWRTMPQQWCDDGQAVHEVVAQHLRRLTHCRQVVDLVPLLEQRQVGEQLVELGVAEFQAKCLRGVFERLPHAASASVVNPLNLPFFR